MLTTHADAPARPATLAWPFVPAFIPLWYAWLAWSWWAELRIQVVSAAALGEAATSGGAEPSGGSAAMDPAAMASVALLARLLASLSEAAVYVLWWKGRGARLPYWRFLCWVVGLSGADLLGFALRRAAEGAPEVLRVPCAVLAGPAALEPAGAAGGALAAFGSLGLLTLLRVGLTGWAQALGTGRPAAAPLALTGGAWLLSRLAGWWSFDLLLGLSPVP